MACRWWKTAAGIVAALLMFLVLTAVLTPADALRGLVQRGAENAGYTFSASTFAKALPLGIKAGNLEFGDDRGPLIRADKAVVRLRLLPLFIGRVSFGYDIRIGKGSIKGEFSPLGKGEIKCAMDGISMEEIPFFQTATGSMVKGELRGEGSFSGSGNKASGSGKVEITRLDLSGVRISGMPLPDASFDTARGAIKATGGRASLESATLQGPGIYVRLKGDFPLITPLGQSPLNLTLEILPKAEFLEKQKLVFMLLVRYLVSPGNYSIPIRGTLAHPAI